MPDSSVALLYHDIVSPENAASSGVVTDGSWRYKLDPERFRTHLETIDDSPFTPSTLTETQTKQAVYLTFDDGGRTAMRAAELLEEYGFRGNFFIITDRVNESGYLTWDEIKQLNAAGHLIGSHTCTHANLLTSDDVDKELRVSKQAIIDRIGTCEALSIPKGAYDRSVFKSAWDAGYTYLLTSEPQRITEIRPKRPIGRWNVWNDTEELEIERILQSSPGYYLRTVGRWKTLKAVKGLIGRERFVRIRDRLL
ncbi:polysaccharide deacetylase family protein [Haloarchaeobius salinus]|uniref:polysaccharide deacetylase family protein n=1 Tax=Haloarchaeobius salinus TaxID=1198298 RepID=UPI00210B5FFA